VARLHRMGASDASHLQGDPRHAGGHRRHGPRVVATESLLLCCPVLDCRRAEDRRISALCLAGQSGMNEPLGCCGTSQDTAELIGGVKERSAAGAASGAGAAAAASTERRVRHALLVTPRRLAISSDQSGRQPAEGLGGGGGGARRRFLKPRGDLSSAVRYVVAGCRNPKPAKASNAAVGPDGLSASFAERVSEIRRLCQPSMAAAESPQQHRHSASEMGRDRCEPQQQPVRVAPPPPPHHSGRLVPDNNGCPRHAEAGLTAQTK